MDPAKSYRERGPERLVCAVSLSVGPAGRGYPPRQAGPATQVWGGSPSPRPPPPSAAQYACPSSGSFGGHCPENGLLRVGRDEGSLATVPRPDSISRQQRSCRVGSVRTGCAEGRSRRAAISQAQAQGPQSQPARAGGGRSRLSRQEPPNISVTQLILTM